MANVWKTVMGFGNNKSSGLMIIDIDKIAFATTVVKERNYDNSNPEPSIKLTFAGGAEVEIHGTLEQFYNNVLMQPAQQSAPKPQPQAPPR